MKKLILLLLFIPIVSCLNGEVRKTYYDSGKLEATATYVDDLRQGEYNYYWNSGELEYSLKYVDGVEQ